MLSAPRIHDRHAQALEVMNIASRDRGAARNGNAGDLGVAQVHRAPRPLSLGGEGRSLVRGRAVEVQHAVFQIFQEQLVEGGVPEIVEG